MKSLQFLLFSFLSIHLHAASLTTNEVFVRLQSVIENDNGFEGLVDDLEDIEGKELVAILKEFDKTWPQLRDRYLKSYREFVESCFTGDAKNEAKKAIREHRKEFMEVFALGEGPMKPLLKTKSMPAVKALRKLLMPTADEIFATAPTNLIEQKKIVLVLAKFRDAIVDTAILHSQEPAVKTLVATEKEAIAKFAGLPRDGLRVIKNNDKIAEKEKVPEDERAGIRELNEWRLLLGLHALVLDPRLCDAGRDHSEDMNKKGFFAHESPVPGKTTPSDRANNFGTTGGGENIYMGSTSPNAANKGWFYSPGHHKNMFRKSYRRIGLGRYERHWTQMFG